MKRRITRIALSIYGTEAANKEKFPHYVETPPNCVVTGVVKRVSPIGNHQMLFIQSTSEVDPIMIIVSKEFYNRMFNTDDGVFRKEVKSASIHIEGKFLVGNVASEIFANDPVNREKLCIGCVLSDLTRFYFSKEQNVIYGYKTVKKNDSVSFEELKDQTIDTLEEPTVPWICRIGPASKTLESISKIYSLCVLEASNMIPLIESQAGKKLENTPETLTALSTTFFIPITRK